MKKATIILMIFTVALSFFCFSINVRAEEYDDYDYGEFEEGYDDFDEEDIDFDDDYGDDEGYDEDDESYGDDEEYDEDDESYGDDEGYDDENPDEEGGGNIDDEGENVTTTANQNKTSNIKFFKTLKNSTKLYSALIILVIILGVYLGYQNGLIKEITDFVALFISMFLSSLLKGPIASLLYNILPFFKYSGNIEGVYSINIIVYQVIIYLLLLILLLFIYHKIIIKFKIKEKIVDTIVEASSLFRILGAVIGAPLMILFVYNILLFAKLPILNISGINNSKVANVIMKKSLIIKNKPLYLSNEYALSTINDSDSGTCKDDKIIKNMIENKLITQDKVNKLIEKNKINKCN